MRILGISPKNSGCGYHRVINPLEKMTEGVRVVTDIPTPELLEKGWDFILYNRICDIDSDWSNIRKITGAKIILDLDDYWILPFGHVMFEYYKQIKGRIENNIREADLVTVTHERLADKVYQLNKKVVVIPNAIPFGEGQYNSERIPDDDVRFFWAGGVSHEQDIEIIRNPMKRLIGRKGVKTVIGGYSANRSVKHIWDRMVSSFTCSLKIPGVVLPSLPVDQYMNHYSHADIVLVPLVNSSWNGMKSNLKLLEASAKKCPVICSGVNPYFDGNPMGVFYSFKQTDWVKNMNCFLKDRDLIKIFGEAIHDWGKRNFDLKDVNKKRIECYNSI